jgi:hypothetical protein
MLKTDNNSVLSVYIFDRATLSEWYYTIREVWQDEIKTVGQDGPYKTRGEAARHAGLVLLCNVASAESSK